jgi:hypothetical protein
MSVVLRRFSEAARVLIGQAVIVESFKLATGRAPPISFKVMMDDYRKDSVFRDSIDLITAQNTGAGFYTTCAPEGDYKQAAKAKAVVDKWNLTNNLDGKLQVLAKELVITGSAVAEKIEPGNLQKFRHIPIRTFDKIITNEVSEFEETSWTKANHVKMGFLQLQKYGGRLIDPQCITHFCWNPIDDSGWGCGIMRTILETYEWQEENPTTGKVETYTRRNLMDMKAAIEEQMASIIEKYGGPLEIYSTESKRVAEELLTQFKSAPRRGARVVSSGKVSSTGPTFEPRARFGEYFNYLFNLACLAGQTPMPRLFTMPGFTEASSVVAKEIGDLIVLPIQRMIKREVEAVWDLVVEQAKYDPERASVRLNWGMQKKPEIQLADLIKLAEISAATGVQYIRPEEIRKNLVKFGFELWEPKSDAAQNANGGAAA